MTREHDQDPAHQGLGIPSWDRSEPHPRSRSPSQSQTCPASPSQNSWTGVHDCAVLLSDLLREAIAGRLSNETLLE